MLSSVISAFACRIRSVHRLQSPAAAEVGWGPQLRGLKKSVSIRAPKAVTNALCTILHRREGATHGPDATFELLEPSESMDYVTDAGLKPVEYAVPASTNGDIIVASCGFSGCTSSDASNLKALAAADTPSKAMAEAPPLSSSITTAQLFPGAVNSVASNLASLLDQLVGLASPCTARPRNFSFAAFSTFRPPFTSIPGSCSFQIRLSMTQAADDSVLEGVRHALTPSYASQALYTSARNQSKVSIADSLTGVELKLVTEPRMTPSPTGLLTTVLRVHGNADDSAFSSSSSAWGLRSLASVLPSPWSLQMVAEGGDANSTTAGQMSSRVFSQ